MGRVNEHGHSVPHHSRCGLDIVDLQVRLAKKAILEHAADLSVQLATERIKKEVTPADQDRLVDRYLQQVKEK